MTKTADERVELKLIARWVAGMLSIMDVAMVLGLGFDYVLPVVVAYPQFNLLETVSALVVIGFLLFVQVFFVPLIAYLFGFPPEDLCLPSEQLWAVILHVRFRFPRLFNPCFPTPARWSTDRSASPPSTT